MKDVFGNGLNVGDTVAFTQPGYTYQLETGVIKSFTPQKLIINWHRRLGSSTLEVQTYKFPKQVAKKVSCEG